MILGFYLTCEERRYYTKIIEENVIRYKENQSKQQQKNKNKTKQNKKENENES